MDPDDQPVQWLLSGAPAGLAEEIVYRGVFPEYDPAEDMAELDVAELATEEDFENYAGVESAQEVSDELERLRAAGHLRRFESLHAAQDFIYTEAKSHAPGKTRSELTIVLSRLALIKKIRYGKTKLRLVVDSKRSRVSKATRKFERVTLPRVTDAVQDALELLASILRADPEADLNNWFEFFVTDFKDAFFQIPLAAAERHFFVVCHQGKYFIALKTVQGSRQAPLTWARLVALVTRLTQSVLGTSGRMSTYVDDPLTCLAE